MLSFHSFKCFLHLLFALLKNRNMTSAMWWKVLAGLRSNHSVTSTSSNSPSWRTKQQQQQKPKYLFLIFKLVTWDLVVSSLDYFSPMTYKNQTSFLSMRTEALFPVVSQRAGEYTEPTLDSCSPPHSLSPYLAGILETVHSYNQRLFWVMVMPSTVHIIFYLILKKTLRGIYYFYF